MNTTFSFLYISLLIAVSFLQVSCEENLITQNVSLTLVSSRLISAENIEIELLAVDEESTIDGNDVNNFVNSATFSLTSPDYNFDMIDISASTTQSGGTFRTIVNAEIFISSNSKQIKDLYELKGEILLTVKGDMGEQSFDLAGRVSYSKSTSSSSSDQPDSDYTTEDDLTGEYSQDPDGSDSLTENDGEENTQNLENSESQSSSDGETDSTGSDNGDNTEDPAAPDESDSTAGDPTFVDDQYSTQVMIMSAAFTRTDQAELIFSVVDETDSLTDSDLEVAFGNGLTEVSFSSPTLTSTPGAAVVEVLRDTDQISVRVLIDITVADSGNVIDSMNALEGRADFSFTLILQGVELSFLKSFFMNKQPDTSINGRTNVFLAGYDTLPDQLNVANTEFRGLGDTPEGINVKHKKTVFFDVAGELNIGGSYNDLDGYTSFDPAGYLYFSEAMKDSVYTSEIKYNLYSFKIGFLACVFLGAEPQKYNDRNNNGGITFTDYSSYESDDDFNFNGTMQNIELHQVFFIGDGKGTDGKFQNFTVPEGAEKVYCGFTDKYGIYVGGYSDNYNTDLKLEVYSY